MCPEWQSLWSEAAAATPFNSPDWLIPWWRHLGVGQLSILALRCGDRLVGLMPLVVRQSASSPSFCLAFLGEGNSDYLDALFEKGFEQPAMEACFGWMEKNGRSRCEFTDLAPCSPLLTIRSPSGWQDDLSAHDVCPVLELPMHTTGLSAALPPHQARNIRYYRARARNLGTLRVECATEQNFTELFREFFRLHHARWAERGQHGVLADPKLERFHFDAASAFLRKKMLRLYVLFIGEKIAGAIYAFMHRRRAYCYLAGFDPGFKPLSPGTLLIAHTIERALAEDCEAVDFLRGKEPYKYFWGVTDRTTYRRTFFRQE